MKNYTIIAKQVFYYKKEVLANSKEEVITIFEDAQFSDFEEVTEIDFELYEIIEKD